MLSVWFTFIIGIEILDNAIIQASNIKGIDITPGKTTKLAQIPITQPYLLKTINIQLVQSTRQI